MNKVRREGGQDQLSRDCLWLVERKRRKVGKGIKKGIVRKVEDKPVNSSVTNYAPEESFGKSQRLSHSYGQIGQWGPSTELL